MKTEFKARSEEIGLKLAIEERRLMDALQDALQAAQDTCDAAKAAAREAHAVAAQAVMAKALAEFRDLEAAEKAAGEGI